MAVITGKGEWLPKEKNPHGIEWQTTITFKNGFFPFRIENEWKFSILEIMKVT